MKRAALAAALVLGGCASPAYVLQAIGGQFELWRAARPLAEAGADPALPEALRQRLALAGRIRDFASRELALPDNGSYRRYADIKRPFVVWNVYAADPLSVEARQWCFPVAGCVAYRGYFAEAAARAFGDERRAEGYDIYIGGVPAYSTLGWFDDPLLNTFIAYPEAELARVIVHELAHQVVYVRDDSEFNESFAMSVEEAGVVRWLAAAGSAAQREAFARGQARRDEFRALVLRYREQLRQAYAGAEPRERKLAAKAALFAALQADYRALRDGPWGGFAGYDRVLGGELNNATLASIGLYHGLVPAFRRLLREDSDELPRFYADVKSLAALPREERQHRLAALCAAGRCP